MSPQQTDIVVTVKDLPLLRDLHKAAHRVLLERLINPNGQPSIEAWNKLLAVHDEICESAGGNTA